MVVSLVLSRLDFLNATLTGISAYYVDHVSPLLNRLHQLEAFEWINYKIVVLAYKCQHYLTPTYLCVELRRPAVTQARRRLRSASSTSLDVRQFDVLVCPPSATERFLLQPLVCGTVFHRTSLLSLSPSIFCCRLKSHLFSLSYPACWLFSHLYSASAVTRHFGHYNRYHISHLTLLFI